MGTAQVTAGWGYACMGCVRVGILTEFPDRLPHPRQQTWRMRVLTVGAMPVIVWLCERQ